MTTDGTENEWLAGHTAVVTGAGSGIGRASAVALARAGAAVMVSDVNDDAGAATLTLIDEAGGEAAYTHCDVSDAEQCGDLI
ncbi:MAG: SDR family NAD(P)-dependent oxidoreductase, partial [Acidimicrobiales bacterium]